jgi:hypothetical protein
MKKKKKKGNFVPVLVEEGIDIRDGGLTTVVVVVARVMVGVKPVVKAKLK